MSRILSDGARKVQGPDDAFLVVEVGYEGGHEDLICHSILASIPACHPGDLGVVPSGRAFAFDQPNIRHSPQPRSVPASLQKILSRSTAPWDS